MKRDTLVARVVVHVRSEASHHPYHHSIGPMFCLLVSLCGLLALAARPAAAQITVGGDPGEVSPADPSTWTNGTIVYVGLNPGKSGTVTMAGGSQLAGCSGYIGYNAGSSGTVSITGAGSTWEDNDLIVGGYGNGTLTVSDGGTVSSGHACIGMSSGSSGTVLITDPGSTWNLNGTTHFTIGCQDGPGNTGTLRIENGGTVDDSRGRLSIGYGTVIVTGPGSTLSTRFGLYGGELRVENGGSLAGGGMIPSGTVTITGVGSAWNNDYVHLGRFGVGTLRVENGGKVSTSTEGCVGVASPARGRATITGQGSAWNNTRTLYVGYSNTSTCNGILTAGSGGQVTAPTLIVNSVSAFNLHVSGDSMLVLGDAATDGSIANAGKVNLYADAFLAAGTYSPITELQGRAIAWSGTGSYNAFGGTWDDGAKTFTVAAATLGDAGVSCGLSSAQRLLITDSATGRRVGASFGTVADGTNFIATPLSGDDLIGLPADQPLLVAWNFSTNFSGDQALLAFDVGAGQTQDLAVWHYDGTRWTSFDAFDLTYGDDGIASFAVTGFGSYAVTVPEPGSVALMILGALAVRCRRQP